MATAYGPRMDGLFNLSVDIDDDTETELATVGGIDTTNVQTKIWVHALVSVDASADTTAVTLTAYIGPVASGAPIGTVTYTSADLEGASTPLSFDGGMEIGPDVQGSEVVLTATVVDASSSSGALIAALIVTIF